jgi:glycerophosphoryl diester phosphodiesterase
MSWNRPIRPYVIGHRGASAGAAENTLAAFSLAAVEGADGIELDVQLSLDGRVMVIHDHTVERTTNGQGRVGAMTCAELQTLDAGGGEVVPTLDEVFATYGRTLLYNVELKEFGWRKVRALATAVADCIQAHNLDDQIIISSFNPLALRAIRSQLKPITKVAHLWHTPPMRLKNRFAAAEADHPHYSQVTQTYMQWANQKQMIVNVWTVDDPIEARRLTKLGVHGLITNKPAFLRQSLSAD